MNKKYKQNPFGEIIKIMDSVNEHYSCPTECNAICCRMAPIQFSRTEYYKILSRVDEKTKCILRTQTENTPNIVQQLVMQNIPLEIARKAEAEGFRQFKTRFCPLLSNDSRCSIYENRPRMCIHYPFKFERFMFDNSIQLEPCQRGLDIGFDFATMVLDAVISNANVEYVGQKTIDIEKFADMLLKESINVYTDKINNEKQNGCTSFNYLYPHKTLPNLLSYLENFPADVRLARRSLILTFVKNHTDKKVERYEVLNFLQEFFLANKK